MNLTRRKFFGLAGSAAAVGVAAPFIDWSKAKRFFFDRKKARLGVEALDKIINPPVVSYVTGTNTAMTRAFIQQYNDEVCKAFARRIDNSIFKALENKS